MPDFRAAFTSGVASVPWTDPPSDDGSKPSRLNPRVQRPHRRRRGTVDTPIQVTATVGGVAGPLDAALSGRLFFGWLAEFPGGSRPGLLHTAGHSSVVHFTPRVAGHYTLVLRRTGSGGVILHVDVI